MGWGPELLDIYHEQTCIWWTPSENICFDSRELFSLRGSLGGLHTSQHALCLVYKKDVTNTTLLLRSNNAKLDCPTDAVLIWAAAFYFCWRGVRSWPRPRAHSRCYANAQKAKCCTCSSRQKVPLLRGMTNSWQRIRFFFEVVVSEWIQALILHRVL